MDLDKHPNIELREYIYDMADVMAAADLVICRAGAATLGELCVLGKPSIIVPSPYVAENHQEKNARAIGAEGCLSGYHGAGVHAGEAVSRSDRFACG